MKIKKIEVENFKAISNQGISLEGCSAIVTAGNNKGKSSLLNGLIKRFQGDIPDIIVKEEQEKGFNIMYLTDGSRIEWKFSENSEKFACITKDNIKMTSGVLKALGEKYFGTKFNIDKFINSSSTEQYVTLAKILGLDLSKIDDQYKEAYTERTAANKALKEVDAQKIEAPAKVDKVSQDELYEIKDDLDKKNEKLRLQYDLDNEVHMKNIVEFNKCQNEYSQSIEELNGQYQELKEIKSYFPDAIDLNKAKAVLDNAPKPKQQKEIVNLEEPIYFETKDIELQIRESSEEIEKYNNYTRSLKDYEDWVAKGKKTKEHAESCDDNVKYIRGLKERMIRNSDIPKEFSFEGDSVLYNGLPLNDNQLSSSSKYIAALKLGAMALGELKTMHFDASFLDNNSLSEVKEWADSNDYQLLIERPDYDCGEIKYEIIEK